MSKFKVCNIMIRCMPMLRKSPQLGLFTYPPHHPHVCVHSAWLFQLGLTSLYTVTVAQAPLACGLQESHHSTQLQIFFG